MKWLRSIVVFDKGGVVQTADWKERHKGYVRSIKSIDNPPGTKKLKIREIEFYRAANGKRKSRRNGVGFLRKRFLEHIVKVEGWKGESQVLIEQKAEAASEKAFTLYPTGQPHEEEKGAEFGDFDFLTTAPRGHKVAIEWETGNISSSHRALNKLCTCLGEGIISVGVLIVPSRGLYKHLTDRIGNIFELKPYLPFWKRYGQTVTKGLLVVSVVEHDSLTDDPSFPYLKVGSDGNAGTDNSEEQ